MQKSNWILILICLIIANNVQGQCNNLPRYNKLIAEGSAMVKAKNYDGALNKFNAAKLLCADRGNHADSFIKDLYKTIRKETEDLQQKQREVKAKQQDLENLYSAFKLHVQAAELRDINPSEALALELKANNIYKDDYLKKTMIDMYINTPVFYRDIALFPGLRQYENVLTISKDGTKALQCNAGKIELWNIAENTIIDVFHELIPTEFYIEYALLSKDARVVVFYTNYGYYLFNIESRALRLICKRNRNQNKSFELSENNEALYIQDNGKLYWYSLTDSSTLTCKMPLTRDLNLAHSKMTVSSDGKKVAFGSMDSNSKKEFIVVWNIALNSILLIDLKNRMDICNYYFKENDTILNVYEQNGRLSQYAVSNGNELFQSLNINQARSFADISTTENYILYSQDGKFIAYTDYGQTLAEFSIKSNNRIEVDAVRYVSDQKLIIVYSEFNELLTPQVIKVREYHIHNTEYKEVLVPSKIGNTGWEADNLYCLSNNSDFTLGCVHSDTSCSLFRVETESNKITYFKGFTGKITCLVLDEAQNQFLTGSNDGSVLVWDLLGNIKHRYFGFVGAINSLSVSIDGKSIAAGCGDSVIVWNVAGKILLVKSGLKYGMYVKFSKNPNQFLCSAGSGAILWDLNKGVKLFTFCNCDVSKATDWLGSDYLDPLSKDYLYRANPVFIPETMEVWLRGNFECTEYDIYSTNGGVRKMPDNRDILFSKKIVSPVYFENLRTGNLNIAPNGKYYTTVFNGDYEIHSENWGVAVLDIEGNFRAYFKNMSSYAPVSFTNNSQYFYHVNYGIMKIYRLPPSVNEFVDNIPKKAISYAKNVAVNHDVQAIKNPNKKEGATRNIR